MLVSLYGRSHRWTTRETTFWKGTHRAGRLEAAGLSSLALQVPQGLPTPWHQLTLLKELSRVPRTSQSGFWALQRGALSPGLCSSYVRLESVYDTPWRLPTVFEATSPCAPVRSWSVTASPPAAHPPLSPRPATVGNPDNFPYRVILSDRDTHGLSGLTAF